MYIHTYMYNNYNYIYICDYIFTPQIESQLHISLHLGNLGECILTDKILSFDYLGSQNIQHVSDH